MVLESFLGEKRIRKNPVLILPLTILISLGSMIIAHNLFPKYSSVLSIAFITIGLVPLIYRIFATEEADEILAQRSCTTFFARHFELIMIFIWVFVGVILTFSISYVVISPDLRGEMMYEQANSYCAITGNCSGGLPSSVTGNAGSSIGMSACNDSGVSSIYSCAGFIFENNAGVLVFAIILSLLYGAGAVFIIVWNASVLGVFFGELFLSSSLGHIDSLATSLLIGHGPPELIGYILGALAGALLSAMVAKGEMFTHDFKIILKDFLFLTSLAFFSVFYGALMEALIIVQSSADVYFIMGIVYLFSITVLVVTYKKNPTFLSKKKAF